MGTAQVAFVGGAVLPEVTCHVRKYVLRMRNRKLRNIRPSGAFSPEVTSGSHVTVSMFCACPAFSTAFFFN
jgi:hypothetical protein